MSWTTFYKKKKEEKKWIKMYLLNNFLQREKSFLGHDTVNKNFLQYKKKHRQKKKAVTMSSCEEKKTFNLLLIQIKCNIMTSGRWRR